jgi:hypothetical protein
MYKKNKFLNARYILWSPGSLCSLIILRSSFLPIVYVAGCEQRLTKSFVSE